ncbi:MAG: hypothetical protein KC619_02145 [Myxococcales bacterium]|nr:hypothetical protein [Myxococcales bacterium]
MRAISSRGAFVEEELDQHFRLTDASVNAVQNNSNVDTAMAGMNQGNYKQYAVTTAEKIIQKGGRVMKAPVSGNANHCQIFGLSLKDANNLFSNKIDW